MITQEKGLRMLAGANPVPKLDVIDFALEAAAYLEILEQGSNEMTQLTTREPEQPEKRTNAMPWLVAAVAVLVVGASILFLNLRGGDEVAAADIDTIEALMSDWNAHDGEAVASHFTADALFDATIHGPFLEPWTGRDEIADRSPGYSIAQVWDSTFDYTQIGEELVFNARFLDTDFGSVERPRGVAVVITDGLIESLVFETDSVYYCIGDTTSRCKVHGTDEIRPAE